MQNMFKQKNSNKDFQKLMEWTLMETEWTKCSWLAGKGKFYPKSPISKAEIGA